MPLFSGGPNHYLEPMPLLFISSAEPMPLLFGDVSGLSKIDEKLFKNRLIGLQRPFCSELNGEHDYELETW